MAEPSGTWEVIVLASTLPHGVKFPNIFGLGLLNETRNLAQFLYACKVTSPIDKRNKNETKKDLLHKVSNNFVCIYSLTSLGTIVFSLVI